MFTDWWKLPGPNNFLEIIGGEIRQGKNLIIALPSKVDLPLVLKIRDIVNGEKRYRWNKISPNTSSPIDYLFGLFFNRSNNYIEKKIKNLWESTSFQAQVFLLENLPEDSIDEWISFLLEYQHYLQNLDLLSRSVFILPTFGDTNLKLPCSDNCLTVIKYQDRISDLDLELFFTHNLNYNSPPTLISKLICSILTQLGNDEESFCRFLLAQSESNVFKPIEILKQYAKLKGWEKYKFKAIENLKTDEESLYLSAGILYLRDKRLTYHSAFLGLYDKTTELDRRIWTGQVKILFPFVEIIRQQLLAKLRDAGILTVPHRKKTTSGYIEILNYYDLEIGDILYQLNLSKNRHHALYFKLNKLVEVLKEIRDSVSHLNPIGYELANKEELLYYEEIINSI